MLYLKHCQQRWWHACCMQVGVHGAGLVNAYFLRPGSAVLEILPCGFGDWWTSQYFFAGSRAEAGVTAFQLKIQNASRCAPSALEKDPAGMAYNEGLWFVRVTFARDQDVKLDWQELVEVFGRVARLNGSSPEQVHAMADEYFVLNSWN